MIFSSEIRQSSPVFPERDGQIISSEGCAKRLLLVVKCCTLQNALDLLGFLTVYFLEGKQGPPPLRLIYDLFKDQNGTKGQTLLPWLPAPLSPDSQLQSFHQASHLHKWNTLNQDGLGRACALVNSVSEAASLLKLRMSSWGYRVILCSNEQHILKNTEYRWRSQALRQ